MANTLLQITELTNEKLVVQNDSTSFVIFKTGTNDKTYKNVILEIDISTQKLSTYNQLLVVASKMTCENIQIIDEQGNKLGAIDTTCGNSITFIDPFENRSEVGLFCYSCKKIIRKEHFSNMICQSCADYYKKVDLVWKILSFIADYGIVLLFFIIMFLKRY